MSGLRFLGVSGVSVAIDAFTVDVVEIVRAMGRQRGAIGLAQRVLRGRARILVGAIVIK